MGTVKHTSTVVNAVKWTREEAQQILIDAAIAEGLITAADVPDFGAGEDDAIQPQVWSASDALLEGVGDDEFLVLLLRNETK